MAILSRILFLQEGKLSWMKLALLRNLLKDAFKGFLFFNCNLKVLLTDLNRSKIFYIKEYPPQHGRINHNLKMISPWRLFYGKRSCKN